MGSRGPLVPSRYLSFIIEVVEQCLRMMISQFIFPNLVKWRSHEIGMLRISGCVVMRFKRRLRVTAPETPVKFYSHLLTLTIDPADRDSTRFGVVSFVSFSEMQPRSWTYPQGLPPVGCWRPSNSATLG